MFLDEKILACCIVVLFSTMQWYSSTRVISVLGVYDLVQHEDFAGIETTLLTKITMKQ